MKEAVDPIGATASFLLIHNGRWVDAGALTVGDSIWRADGSTGAVESVEVVAVEQRMYNLTVDTAHTFFVGQDAWLVHNSGPCADLIKSGKWSPVAISSDICKNGCAEFAIKAQESIGGKLVQFTSNLPQAGRRAPLLPSYGGRFFQWQDHWAVFKDGRVYDAFTGDKGLPYAEYMQRWGDFADEVNVNFQN